MTSPTTLSVVIPTYNNASVLPQTLASVAQQELPPGREIEVVVSDDGSTDETVAVAHAQAQREEQTVHVLEGEHGGAARARNQGLKASTGALVLFLGADILLRPGALLSHIRFYERDANNNAAIGFVVWDPRLPPSPLMEWAVHGGPQNNFDDLLGQAWVDAAHFGYGSHLSVRRSALGDVRWPEMYHTYGWEDLDFGRQLAAKGITLAVLHDAVGHHAHAISTSGFLKRQYMVGGELCTYQERYPSIGLIPDRRASGKALHWLYRWSGVSLVVRFLLQLLPSQSFPEVFSIALRDAFWRGVRSRRQY